ncbi:MAG: 50S ribosomal protein L29 [candidate division Zixibacteria bacterium]|nr:50S ribosomal protein L29 [candidate division Zixibacteria bacterium]
MKARDLRDLTIDEVLQKREEVVKEKFNLKLRQATRQIDNPLRIRLLRRDLARLNTIIREHELKISPIAESAAEVKDRQAVDEK